MASLPTADRSTSDRSTHEQAASNSGADCVVEQFPSEEEHPKKLPPEKKVLFPYLDLSGLDEYDKLDLEDRLKYDTREMIIVFANFTLAVNRSLENAQVPLARIRESIFNLEAFTEDVGAKVIDEEDRYKIEEANSLSEVFITLRNYISFFNYQIVEYIIHEYGSSRDRQKLGEFLKIFHNYGKRNIFEVPQDVFLAKSRKAARELALKCTEGVTTMNCVEVVKGKVSRVLGLHPFALQLCLIKKGCVELHFFVSAAVADRIFPVSPAQHSALGEIGVRLLSCENTSKKTSK